MINKLLINLLFFTSQSSSDSIPLFRNEVEKIARYMEPPYEYYSSDTCYLYSGVLKIEINNLSKIASFVVSDGSPTWVKENINKQKERKHINFKKLDSLALKKNLKNIIIIFPLILEIEGNQCKKEIKSEILSEKYFHFGGKNMKGNIRFENPIYFIFYKGNPDHDTNYQEIKPKAKPLLSPKNKG